MAKLALAESAVSGPVLLDAMTALSDRAHDVITRLRATEAIRDNGTAPGVMRPPARVIAPSLSPRHFGASRTAPSSRITSPLSISLVMIWCTSLA